MPSRSKGDRSPKDIDNYQKEKGEAEDDQGGNDEDDDEEEDDDDEVDDDLWLIFLFIWTHLFFVKIYELNLIKF